MKPRTNRLIVGLAILLSLASPLIAQKTGSGGTIIERPRPADEPRQTTRAPVKIITRVVEKPVTPLTGRLFVAAEAGAVVLIEPLNIRGADAQKGTVPDGQRTLIFNDLKPGNYRIAATLAGFHEVEKSSIPIKRNESQSVTLDFQPILYSVVIQSNVDGELKYGQENEVPKSVPIQNNRTTLYLKAGEYVAELEPAEPVYKTEHKKFSITGDTTVAINLKRIEFSKDTFRAEWTETELKNWEVPAGWHVGSGKLIVKGAGVALPRDESKRYYKDFQVIADAKIVNGVGAAVALRAQDAKNYYLIEFTGEQSDEPLYVRLFIVKNGLERRLQAIQIPKAAAAALKAGNPNPFTTHIQVTDNRVAVSIFDNESATDYPLGVLIDPDRTFAAGGVGVAARNNEESLVWRFIVCTECPKD